MHHDLSARLSIFAVAGHLALAGCASLAPGAVSRLSGLDPLLADPSVLSLAAVMPVPTKLRDGDVIMTISVSAPAPLGAIEETFLFDVTEAGDTPGIIVNAGTERLHKLVLTGEDAGRMRAVQAKIKAAKAAGIHGQGKFSVGIKGGCLDGRLGDGPLIAAVFMRTQTAEDYFPLLKSVDLRKMAGEEAIARLPACG
ncbi:MAG: hypothetical protein IPL47_04925 [Phyllobacteriaceae bacterium]|nr:hypothetical protein [Phyllobacteriaceae bacterium]